MRAAERDVGVELVLRATQPVVLQGDRGLSVKGPEPGNASYYYSLTRLAAAGTVSVGDVRHRVAGEAWLDREWSTSALSPGLTGWDWFSLQLDDDSELMVYRLRTEAGGTSPFSAGTWVGPGGRVVRLGPDDFTLEETSHWDSPRGGRYPSGWRIRIAPLELELEVAPRIAAQELDLAFRYWEGTVLAEGRRGGRAVAGRGYVELTGYADSAPR
ncbi:MAG: lipocalin family protein [Gemmatimonadota bacterium]